MCDEEEKIPKVLSATETMILTGRIYPAIQSCVRNRYYIILGIFAYYGFILTADKFWSKISHQNLDAVTINLFVSIIFTFFVFHNLINYWSNGEEEYKLEGKKDKIFPDMELLFSITALSLIWGAQFILFKGNIYNSIAFELSLSLFVLTMIIKVIMPKIWDTTFRLIMGIVFIFVGIVLLCPQKILEILARIPNLDAIKPRYSLVIGFIVIGIIFLSKILSSLLDKKNSKKNCINNNLT